MNTIATRPIEHARRLAGEIGSRMAGTAGGRAAAAYIAGAFERAGLAVEMQEFETPDWSEQSAEVTMGDHTLAVFANTFSPPCDVTAPLLPAGSLDELDAAGLAGKIVVLYGDLVRGPLAARDFFFAAERDVALLNHLENQRAAAVITVHPSLGQRTRLIEDRTFTIPSATAPLDAGLALIRAAGQTARLKLECRSEPGRTANVIARLPGMDPAGERVVVCAHYDTKHDTPGAGDNAGGVAVMLALAEKLARQAARPALEFVAFTNEEYYTSPERDVYLRAAGASFPNIVAAINIDGVGRAVSTGNLATFAGSPAFEEWVDSTRAGFPGIVRVEPWPASNHFLFFSNGVPSVALSSTGPHNLDHTPEDRPEWLGEEKLEEMVSLASCLVAGLLDRRPAWSRP